MDFVKGVLEAFSKINKEIDLRSSEQDIRGRIIIHFIRDVLGYSGREYQDERGRTDLTVFDENNFRVLVIETKKLGIDIDTEEMKEYAFKRTDGTTKYVGLTNGVKFKLWEIVDKGQDKLRVNLDFDAILKHKRPTKLTSEERSQIFFLDNLRKEVLMSEAKYQDFTTYYGQIDIKNEDGFKRLLERLGYIIDLLMSYTQREFDEYQKAYSQYLSELEKIEEEIKLVKGNEELVRRYERAKRDLETQYQQYLLFRGYEVWKKYSGREDRPEEENKEVFCKETIYVMLNKLLFIRICEDRGLLPKNISNGGIENLKSHLLYPEESYKDILNIAYRTAGKLYSHFYELGLLDWYVEGNHELNRVLNRTLWILNRFNFSGVDRDILGKLYEKYLPKEERKRLGEFYTPEEVIDYILHSVGYTPDNEIEGKDLLDFGCGSGGFLVRALNRLIERYRKKGLGSREILDNVIDHIYGFDINPFACHIAEMNLLFQIIDLYQEARSEDRSYSLKRFKIYQTDSLDPPKETREIWEYGERIVGYTKERMEIDRIKRKKFDFIVGNPPYVRKERIDPQYKEELLSKNYPDVYHGDNDLCVYFIARAINWLKNNGKFGYITSGKFTKARYGERIRGYIPNTCKINQFLDFRGVKVFQDVTNDPVVLIMTKEIDQEHRISNEIRVVEIKREKRTSKELMKHIQEHIVEKEFKDNYLKVFSVIQTPTQEVWRLTPDKILNIITQIEKNSDYLLNHVCDVYYGLKPGKVSILVVDQLQAKNFENQILKPILRGEDVRRYEINYRNLYLIFPYEKNEKGEYVTVDIENYPKIKGYLSRYRKDLANRYDIKKSSCKWYELRPCDYYHVFEKEKILTPDISERNNFALDREGYLCLDTCFIVSPKDEYKQHTKYFLGLLNSKVLELYFKQISAYLGKKGYRYKKQYLDKLPIRLPKEGKGKILSHEITHKVNQIISLNDKVVLYREALKDFFLLLKGIEATKLSDFPFIIFNITGDKLDQIKRDKDTIYLSLIDSIECKDEVVARYIEAYLKSIRDGLRKSKDLKKEIFNIMIPKNREDIERVVNEYGDIQKQLEELPSKIQKLENEIDQKVYELYGLNEEEIKIIEESLR